jgi:amino acid transporter
MPYPTSPSQMTEAEMKKIQRDFAKRILVFAALKIAIYYFINRSAKKYWAKTED